MPAPTVTIAGVDRTCDTTTGLRVTLGRTSVRETGQPSTLALSLAVDETLPFVQPFDEVRVEVGGLVRFAGTVAEATLEHPAPGSEPAAVQRIAAVGPLASWGATNIGDEPWPQETIEARAARVAALIDEPLVVQGGQDWEVVRLDVDDRRAIAILDELAASVGGWLYDAGGTVYLQALTARAVQTASVAWVDEPLGEPWSALDGSVTWIGEDWNPYLPIMLDGCYIRWAPGWAATTEVATTVRLEYGKSPDWSAAWDYLTTGGAPATGQLRMDNAGNISIHATDADGIDRSGDLDTVVPGTELRFGNRDYAVTGIADAGAYRTLTVTPTTRPVDTGRQTVEFKYAQPYIELTDIDAESRYGARAIKLTSQLAEEGDATTLANLILSRSAVPAFGFPSVEVDLDRLPSDLAAEILAVLPGVRITITNLPQPAPQEAFNGVVEGWTELYGPGGATRMTLHLSDIRHSLAVPTWEALPFDHLWSDEPAGEPWELELL